MLRTTAKKRAKRVSGLSEQENRYLTIQAHPPVFLVYFHLWTLSLLLSVLCGFLMIQLWELEQAESQGLLLEKAKLLVHKEALTLSSLLICWLSKLMDSMMRTKTIVGTILHKLWGFQNLYLAAMPNIILSYSVGIISSCWSIDSRGAFVCIEIQKRIDPKQKHLLFGSRNSLRSDQLAAFSPHSSLGFSQHYHLTHHYWT